MRDSIKYIEPIYTNAQRDDFKWDLEQPDYKMDDRFDDVNHNRDVMYESTESRYATELVNVPADKVTIDTNDKSKIKVAFDGGALTGNYIPKDSSLSIFVGGKKMAIAIMGPVLDGSTGAEWFGGKEIQIDATHVIRVKEVTETEENTEFTVQIKGVDADEEAYTPATLSISGDKLTFSYGEDSTTVRVLAVGRFDSEKDLTGMHLGECELQMKTYYFNPRRISMGVTWTDMTELYLDLSFGVSAEDTLIDSVGQEIKKALDFQAVEYANRVQKVRSGNTLVQFDAEAGNTISVGNTVIKDSYWHTAQTFTQALGHVSDEMLNIFNRGGVTAIVGGPRACRYLELIEGYSTKGAQPPIGGHQVGELNGIPVFKVPSKVIADDELLTTWKNEQAEGDVSIAIGTLVPFASTGKLPRKNFYFEQGIARYEDMQALQPRYLGRVLIKNIR